MVLGSVLGSQSANGTIPTTKFELHVRTVFFSCCGGTSVQNGVSPFGFHWEPSSHRLKDYLVAALRLQLNSKSVDFGAVLRGGSPSFLGGWMLFRTREADGDTVITPLGCLFVYHLPGLDRHWSGLWSLKAATIDSYLTSTSRSSRSSDPGGLK